jgi:hypothetical protein
MIFHLQIVFLKVLSAYLQQVTKLNYLLLVYSFEGKNMVSFPDISADQRKLLLEFYSKPLNKIALNKNERKSVWNEFKKSRDLNKFSYLKENVPAIFAEMSKSLIHKKNIQPAVFSECVYAQAIADKFLLINFENHIDSAGVKFDLNGLAAHNLSNLSVRYSYTSLDKKTSLIQAGGGGAVDCALISFFLKSVFMIELKEPYARTPTPDLPKYEEDGYLVSSDKFEVKYPQFMPMLEEQLKKKLNVFEHLGSNVPDFSAESIAKAVSESYSGQKYAHVICTEDSSGFLVMLPINHLSRWARLEGEIRPSGRNSYKVWSPKELLKTLKDKNATIQSDKVSMPISELKPSKERGGEETSRFKISPLFFVRAKDIKTINELANFKLSSVMQNIPDITAKMNFANLNAIEVQNFYTKNL